MDGIKRGGVQSSGGGLSTMNRHGAYQQNGYPLDPPRPRFPNIKDLQDQASSLNISEDTSVCRVLEDGCDSCIC